jgi:ABC-type multidrug transport system permease subunit
MHDALEWLASFFPKYGTRALCLAVLFALAAWVCSMIAPARPCVPWLWKLAAACFVAFVLMACFFAFRA